MANRAAILLVALALCSCGRVSSRAERAAAERALMKDSAVLEKRAASQARQVWPEVLTGDTACTVRNRQVEILDPQRAMFSVTFQCRVTPRPPDGKERVAGATVSGELGKGDAGWSLTLFY